MLRIAAALGLCFEKFSKQGKPVFIPAFIVRLLLLLLLSSTGSIFAYTSETGNSQQGQKRIITAAAAGAHSEKELVETLHRQVNEFRRSEGLKPLALDPIISAQARKHSADMVRKGNTISHRGFDERLREIREKISYRAAAENVATNLGHENAARSAVEGWKNSPAHRKNMLGDYSLTGIGVARSEQGQYFFTQIFLKP